MLPNNFLPNAEPVEDWTADAPMPEMWEQAETFPSTRNPVYPAVLNSYSSSSSSSSRTHPQVKPEPVPSTSRMELVDRSFEDDDDDDLIDKMHTMNIPDSRLVHVKSKIPVTCANIIHPSTSKKEWALVHYYEEKEKLGLPFMARTDQFTIDGCTTRYDPTRMSISSMPTNGCRVSGAIRNQLGPGIKIVKVDDKVKLRCITESPVFVQCPQRAELNGDMPNTVYRMSAKDHGIKEMTIFDGGYFVKILEKRKQFMPEQFYMLHTHCITRISFVKGFGECYPRKMITQSPSWIEIHMTYMLKKFDEIYRSLSMETMGIHSDT